MKGGRRKAVALEYKEDRDRAPHITAKGENLMAERIEAVAKEKGIPVMDIPGLAESLYTVETGREIPEEFYGITAEILSFVYSLEEKE
ncbi:MAG: EscU/YscU/HrcU family type III secretion system export apparatus switch protein [Spirochaetales bacterium]|nr:EscU/YscU/HrcU family type III secretion system export apparatus switch protein [Spirochaetales bacterium]